MKIIDVDLERRRISLSIKQAAEGGTVAAEYRELYGEHNYDEAGNYIGPAFEAEAPSRRPRAAPPRRGRPSGDERAVRERGRGRRPEAADESPTPRPDGHRQRREPARPATRPSRVAAVGQALAPAECGLRGRKAARKRELRPSPVDQCQ